MGGFAPTLTSIIALAAGVPADDPALDPERLADLEARMAQLVADGRRVGIAWAVARDGEILASGAHGYRDLAARQPMTPDTVFRIYSMTRAVTAVALLQLVEQGKVDLDAPVGDYLPELAELREVTAVTDGQVTTRPARTPVTARQLLTYTAGFAYAPQYPASVGVDHRAILDLSQTPAEAMARLASYPLRDAPGARWRYGYHADVLGALIETVSGQRLDDYYREHIFAPLGMDDTGFRVPPGQAGRLVRAYGDGGIDLTGQLPPSSDYLAPTRFHSGGGGLVSTLADWAKFAAVLAGDGALGAARLIAPDTVAAVRRNQLTAGQGPLFWYEGADLGQPGFSERWQGYGWGYSVGVRLADGEHVVPGRPGEISWGGLANTNWLADPRSRLVAMVFAQYLGEDAPATDVALREALFGPR